VASNGAEELLVVTGLYIAGMVLSVPLILVNAFLPIELRLIVWAGFGILWMVALWLVGRSPVAFSRGLIPTDSLVERFGLFTIIVLGEVVFRRGGWRIAAGTRHHDDLNWAIALLLGFGFWWIYFDMVGGRLPRNDGRALASWKLSHYAITLSIAIGGPRSSALLACPRHIHSGRDGEYRDMSRSTPSPGSLGAVRWTHHMWEYSAMTQSDPERLSTERSEQLPAGELRPDDRGQDEAREALEESIRLGQARPLTREEREAAERDPGIAKTVYAPASERVPKPPLPADEKLIDRQKGE